MEMEDHQRHHQYSIPDLRQLITGRPLPPHFNPNITPSPSDLFPSPARNLAPHPHHHHPHHYDMLQMVGARDLLPRGLHEFPVDSSATVNAAAAVATVSTPSSVSGFDNDGGMLGGDGGTGRWPRQETLTLLEIRSRLDSKFKEANQKGPLWDEVSRIMSEEHGYQRSGKKCREKFENLYKYYKKTKEGKAGRQDGKHYRFFRQLEALYGDASSTSVAAAPEYSNLVGGNFQFNSNPNNNVSQEGYHPLKLSDSLSLSNHTSEFDTSSEEEENDGGIENESRRKRRGGRSWKVKIKEFIDAQMRKLMERQEAWLEKLTKTLEQKEQERMSREEEWRKQDAERIDREHKFWAKERSWIEARDAALMEALQTLKGKEAIRRVEVQIPNEEGSHDETVNDSGKEDGWGESEIRSLIQLRSSMESRFLNVGCSEEILWEEISSKLACLGYDQRSVLMCREKWYRINNNFLRKKKRVKENSNRGGGGDYYHTNEDLYNPVVGNYSGGSSPSNSNVGNAGAVNDGCFPFLLADGDHNLWGNYGLKLNKGED